MKRPIDPNTEIERARQAMKQFDCIVAPTTAGEHLTRALLRRGLADSLAESVAEHVKSALRQNRDVVLDLASLIDVEAT